MAHWLADRVDTSARPNGCDDCHAHWREARYGLRGVRVGEANLAADLLSILDWIFMFIVISIISFGPMGLFPIVAVSCSCCRLAVVVGWWWMLPSSGAG